MDNKAVYLINVVITPEMTVNISMGNPRADGSGACRCKRAGVSDVACESGSVEQAGEGTGCPKGLKDPCRGCTDCKCVKIT